MSLVRGSINPLNAVGARRLRFVPKHFATMIVPSSVQISEIDEWIYKNLDSRYAITPALSVDTNNHLVTAYKIGVEDAKELTMLSLSCPHLDKK